MYVTEISRGPGARLEFKEHQTMLRDRGGHHPGLLESEGHHRDYNTQRSCSRPGHSRGARCVCDPESGLGLPRARVEPGLHAVVDYTGTVLRRRGQAGAAQRSWPI